MAFFGGGSREQAVSVEGVHIIDVVSFGTWLLKWLALENGFVRDQNRNV